MTAADATATILSGDAFRAFQLDRPDHERWELYAGRPVMMTPPTTAHQIITTNLVILLSGALNESNDARIALPAIGVDLHVPDVEANLGGGDYRPEPDVAIVDRPDDEKHRYSEQVYLAAEIVSSSDLETIAGGRSKLAAKVELYKAHQHCSAVLEVAQGEMKVLLHRKSGADWRTEVLLNPSDVLRLSEFGLECDVSQVYRGAPVEPREGESK